MNNLTWIKGDITAEFITTTFIWIQRMSNIHLYLVNLYLVIKGEVRDAAVKGLCVCIDGSLAELVYVLQRQPARGDR